MKDMTLEYDVSEQDYINFNLFHMNNSKEGKRTKLILTFIPLIGLCIFMGVLKLTFSDELTLEYNMTVIYIIAFVITVTLILSSSKRYERRIRKALKRHISGGKNNDFIGRHKLTLGKDGIESISSDTTANVKYTAVERVECAYGCIYIYVGAIKAFIVRLDAFSDAEQKNKFMKILQDKSGTDTSRYCEKIED